MAPSEYWCGKDICTVGKHFCDVNHRSCRFCLDDQGKRDCFTERHQYNCTEPCRGYFEEQLIEKHKMQPCMSMPELQHGYHNGSTANTTSYGEIIAFGCDDNYRLVGPNTTTCDDFGKWTSGPPICEMQANCSTSVLFIAAFCTVIFVLIFAVIAIGVLMRKLKHVKKGSNDEESPASTEANTPLIDRREPVKAPEPGDEPIQDGDDEETERKYSVDEDGEEGEGPFRGVQEQRKGATGELHLNTVEPRIPRGEYSEEESDDERASLAQAQSYHQQERQNEGTHKKVAMEMSEVDRQDFGYPK